ncbi:MAG: hypothetical protein JXA06_08900 [Bacteroidetes bacterium]|nr:hypothetical protein [Bacteroidota bacterium]
MKQSKVLLLITVFAVLTLLWGCSDESTGPGETGSGDVTVAYTELENQMFTMTTIDIQDPSDLDQVNFIQANQYYKDAVSKLPNDPGANFGAGLTEILMIYADPAVNSMVKRWDSVALGKNSRTSFFRFGIPTGTKDMSVPTQALAKNVTTIIKAAAADPPLIGEMQTLMRDNILPHIEYALARFAVVESNPDFEFTISGKMQGDPNLDSLMLDNTEIYIMDGVLMGIKAVVEQFLVYRFDLTDYSTESLIQALQPNNTSFFYLASDGQARSMSVLADVKGMIGKFKSAINFLKAETDNQADDVIKIGTSGDRTVPMEDIDTTIVYLDKALNFLTSTQSLSLEGADSEGNDYTITLNISQLYNNPPQNPKTAWFPAYTLDSTDTGEIQFDFVSQTYESLTFPDPTFSGLIVGIKNETTGNTDKNENLKKLLGLEEMFEEYEEY